MRKMFNLDLDTEKTRNAKYAFLGVDFEQVRVLAERFDVSDGEIATHLNYRTIRGEIDGHPVLAMSSGIGGPAVSIAIHELATLGVHTVIAVQDGSEASASFELIAPTPTHTPTTTDTPTPTHSPTPGTPSATPTTTQTPIPSATLRPVTPMVTISPIPPTARPPAATRAPTATRTNTPVPGPPTQTPTPSLTPVPTQTPARLQRELTRFRGTNTHTSHTMFSNRSRKIVK